MTKEQLRKEINILKERIQAHEYSLGNWMKLVNAERRDLKLLEQHLHILTTGEFTEMKEI